MQQHHQQKSPKKYSYLYELIENCKYITSQDKLYLRNVVKQNQQQAHQILNFFQQSGKPLKKLKFYEKQFREAEVKLRKYIIILKRDPNNQILLKSKESANIIKNKSISPCKITSSAKKNSQNITQSNFSLARSSTRKQYLEKNIKSWRLQKNNKGESQKIDQYLNYFKDKDKKCLQKSNYIINKTEVDSNISKKIAVNLQYENKKKSTAFYDKIIIPQNKQTNSNYMCIEKTLNLEGSIKKSNNFQIPNMMNVTQATTQNLSPSFYTAKAKEAFAQSEKIIQKMLLESQRLVQDYEMSKHSEVSAKVKQISSSIKQIMTQPQFTHYDGLQTSNQVKVLKQYDMQTINSYRPLSNLNIASSVSIQNSPLKNRNNQPLTIDLFTPIDLLEQCRRIISKSRIRQSNNNENISSIQTQQYQYQNSKITLIDNIHSQKQSERDWSIFDKKHNIKKENFTTFGKKQQYQQKRMHSPFLEIQLKNSIQKSQPLHMNIYTVQGILKSLFSSVKNHKLLQCQYQSILLTVPQEIQNCLSRTKLQQYTIQSIGQKLQQQFAHQSSISRDLLNVIDLQNEKKKEFSIKSIERFLKKMQEAFAPNISEIQQSLWKLYYNTKNQFNKENLGFWQLFYMQIKQQQSLLQLCSSLQEYQFEIQPAIN